MSTAITAPTYDPISTAQSLATKSTADAQQQLTTQTSAASATATALTQLGSAISSFQTSLGSLGGLGKSILAQSAILSDNTIGTATAKSTAAAGTYSLFVQQVATAGQVSYDSLTDGMTAGGTLTVKLGNEATSSTTASFDVDLSVAGADTDGDGKLSVREVAAALNHASGNTGLVSAGVVTIPNADGTSDTRLVLTSKNPGVANTISLDASAVRDGGLQSGLAGSNRTIVTQAQDATILLGGKNGTPITQGSNTFTNIDGVSFTVTRAQASTDNPLTLSVASDSSGTTANAQAFVDAYNKIKSAIDKLVDSGDSSSNKAGGAFANDSGVKALQNRLVDLLRPTVGGLSLASYGITAARDGTLTLDSTRLTKQLVLNPNGLDKLMGSASSSGSSGILGSLDTYLDLWSDSAHGQIQQRTSANTKLQSSLTKRQDDITAKYNTAYDRYLKQFTDLQTLQATMNSNVSMFDAIFSDDKSS
jgi:flagellar hook-associated protein 2